MTSRLRIYRLHEDVLIPVPNPTGFTVHAYLKTETGRPNTMILPPRATRAVPTRILALPPINFAVFTSSHSELIPHSIFVSPTIPDPKSEVFIFLHNGSHETHWIRHEDRIGNLLVLPFTPMELVDMTPLGKVDA